MPKVADPTLQVWEVRLPDTTWRTVVLSQGLIAELQDNPDDPRREQLAELVLGQFKRRRSKDPVPFQHIEWRMTIARVNAGETSLI